MSKRQLKKKFFADSSNAPNSAPKDIEWALVAFIVTAAILFLVLLVNFGIFLSKKRNWYKLAQLCKESRMLRG